MNAASINWATIGVWAGVVIAAIALVSGAKFVISNRQKQRGGKESVNLQAGRDIRIDRSDEA
jgi:hypothetical protein